MTNMQELISNVAAYVEKYMRNYDGSHDFNHIQRVLGLSHHIYNQILKEPNPPALDRNVITLGALLHDVGDRKYVQEDEDATTMVRDVLLDLGASRELAETVQTICLGVSYSSEKKNPGLVMGLIARHPELAVVQDADRIDAIGAVGIGRFFTYGGARTKRSMNESVKIMDEKLFKLEEIMKTGPGKELARERTRRLREFYQLWKEEMGIGLLGQSVLEGKTTVPSEKGC